MDLSLNLKAIVAQQLVPTPDGKGRKAVIEVLINSPLVADMIRKGEVHKLKELMAKSNETGMQTSTRPCTSFTPKARSLTRMPSAMPILPTICA